MKIRTFTRKDIQFLEDRHFKYPGSILYAILENGPWYAVPNNPADWQENWIFVLLELENTDKAKHPAESFASRLKQNVEKIKISRETPLHTLELPTRIHNCLRTAKLRTIGELFDYKWTNIMFWNGLGRMSRNSLIELMSKYELE